MSNNINISYLLDIFNKDNIFISGKKNIDNIFITIINNKTFYDIYFKENTNLEWKKDFSDNEIKIIKHAIRWIENAKIENEKTKIECFEKKLNKESSNQNCQIKSNEKIC